jgi:putative transposase
MKKTGKKQRKEQSASGQLPFPFAGMARESLLDAVILSGFGFVQEELEAERTALCGVRYAHQEQRHAVRAGHVPSSLVLGGRRVEIPRPRARSIEGGELSLPSWQAWSSRDPLEERAMEQMVVGVSTRRYARSLEPLPQALSVRGISKSAVSERFVVGTQRRLAELMRRDLSGLKLVALLIDGVHFAEHVVLAAVGIDASGEKHSLGLREGATENAAACTALLTDLIERGLNPNQTILVLIDGAKALRKAVLEVFGARALLHRCHAHKKRNVVEALPQRSQARAPAARESGPETGVRPSRRRRFAAGGVGRNPHRDAPGVARELGAGSLLDQPDREPVQPGARDRATGQTLARRNNGSQMDRGRRARCRAPLPQNRRLSGASQTGRRTSCS